MTATTAPVKSLDSLRAGAVEVRLTSNRKKMAALTQATMIRTLINTGRMRGSSFLRSGFYLLLQWASFLLAGCGTEGGDRELHSFRSGVGASVNLILRFLLVPRLHDPIRTTLSGERIYSSLSVRDLRESTTHPKSQRVRESVFEKENHHWGRRRRRQRQESGTSPTKRKAPKQE